jgi:hypothetical protein
MTARSRRLVAAATTFIVVWTSLWSLVSAAHASLVGEEVMLCHQAGSMVAMGEMPMKQGGGGKTHCPLCIMAFYGSAPPPLAIPPLQFSTHFVTLPVYEAPRPQGLQVPLPPSRAPPLSSAT